ncbi:lysophospholipid acyltransferase family protein [Marinicella sediminis]|uniref:Lysophospholipid acyltransferase family protein n=1 Tax=Marinicella sediminis TaxID=1792834 RepID=A0ABV7JGA6_9GAMM|nr:lysophospholipid acyltransferase family protein [Marinicella sediminis]
MSYSRRKTDLQVALARFLAKRSTAFRWRLGKLIGWLFFVLPNSRKRIARINIKLCFPQLSATERKQLLKRNLQSTGLGVMEMVSALWADHKAVEKSFTISGLEQLEATLNKGRGCLLLSCHTTSIEWGIRGLNAVLHNQALPVGHMLARQHNNKLLEAHLEQARLAFVDKLIDKKNIRSLLASVQSGHPVYYAPDQNFSYQVRFSDFFGVPAATTTGTHKLASRGVPVIPWFCFRTSVGQWHIEVLPEWVELGQMDEQVAAQAINQLFEQQINRYPDQYLWVHRRFKNQPKGQHSPY